MQSGRDNVDVQGATKKSVHIRMRIVRFNNMNLCASNHEEICHEGFRCPICELIEEKDDEILELRNKIESLSDN